MERLEAVDLGLSVKWAAMNVGAAGISDPGAYFAWGETAGKDDYTWGAYRHGASAERTGYHLRPAALCGSTVRTAGMARP